MFWLCFQYIEDQCNMRLKYKSAKKQYKLSIKINQTFIIYKLGHYFHQVKHHPLIIMQNSQPPQEDQNRESSGTPRPGTGQETKMKKKQLSCALSRQNSLKLPSDMENASAANSEGRIQVEEVQGHGDSIAKERRRKVRLEPLLDEDASGAPSELYETDSSNDQGSFIQNDNNSSSSSDKLLGPGLQGQDIVAGSPAKVPDVAATTQNENDEPQAEAGKEQVQYIDDERGREEMGGVIVYDSYAKLTGCTKIVDYFAAQERRKVDTRILFSQQETKTMQKLLFYEKARERDFQCDYDRNLWRNLPRFQTQRDFTNPQFSIHVPQQQNVLIFDSRFENGNLRKAAKVNNVEYNLWLENDLNTKGHTQWYYFKVEYKDIAVRADKKSHNVKFNVLNLAKTTSLYQVGMKPCIWSRRKFEEEGVGWFRGGEEVTYTQNNILRETDFTADHQKMHADENNNNAFLYNNNGAGEGVDTYFTLSFKYAFAPNQDDEVWFAHAIPSTYTQLQESLLKLRESPEYEPFLRMNLLCQSLAKTPVPVLTITENVDTYLDYYEEIRLQTHLPGIVKKSFKQKYNNTKKLAKQSQQTRGQVKALLDRAIEEELRQFFEYNEDHFIQASPSFQGFGQRLINYVKIHSQKKAIIITSRVHPGEPQASHMVNGLIAYLLSPKAFELRRHFIFRIVPMLNPDGVIYGNYRCSLLGCDLNRKWDKPNKYLHPPIYYAKNIVRHMHQERKVLLFCDLHGHSRKQNAFFYGCCYKNYEHEGRIKNARLRIIPLMCCQKNELFKLRGCRFRLERGREATARVAIFKEFNIMNSFTLECSFFGKEHSQKKPIDKSDPFSMLQQQTRKLEHMSQEDYESLGETLMKTMHSYLPGEQHLLEFVSGKILDVFYDEFVKFIPPFMLKREREKIEQREEEARKEQGKNRHDAVSGVARSSLKPHVLNKLATSDLGGQLLMMPGQNNNSTQRSLQRQQTLHVTQSMAGGAQGGNTNASALQGSPQFAGNAQHGPKPVHTNLVGIQEVSGGLEGTNPIDGGAVSQFRNSQDYNGQEDNPQQAEQVPGRPNNPKPRANFNYKDSSSDQQAQNMFLSGNDTDNTNQGQGGRMGTNFHSNKEEMLEFETFFDNIQQKMKRKEMVKAQRAQLKDGEAPLEDLGDLSEDEDSGTSSDDQTYKERTRKAKKKKKKPNPTANYGKGQKTGQRKKEAREDDNKTGGAKHKSHQPGHRDYAGAKNKSQSSTAAAYAAANRPARSPRHQQLDALAPVLASKKAHDKAAPHHLRQEDVPPQMLPISDRQGPTGPGTVDKGVISGDLTDVRTSELQPCPAEAILRSSEIQGLIKSQLSTGVLNQTEIMQVIQRAILKNQALAQLRAQQNKNRLLVNHPQSEVMPDNAKPLEDQNHPTAEKQRKNQPGKPRKESDQQLKPLRIATTEVQGYQLAAQPQYLSPQQHLVNENPGATNVIGQGLAAERHDPQVGASGGILFNPARPTDDSKESPLLPPQARHGKYLGHGSNFHQPQAVYYQQQSQYANQLQGHGQQSQQPSLMAFQHPSLGGHAMYPDANALAKLNAVTQGGLQSEAQLAQSASQAQRGPKSQLSQHGTAEKLSQVSVHSPQLRAKGRNGPGAEGFAIVPMPSHSQTVKIDKTRKFQTLGRPSAQAIVSSAQPEFNNLMLRNATDVRELPSVYEGSPVDPFGRQGKGAGLEGARAPEGDGVGSALKRPAQSAMQDRQNDEEPVGGIEKKNSRSLSGQQSVAFVNSSKKNGRQSTLHNDGVEHANGEEQVVMAVNLGGDGRVHTEEKEARDGRGMRQLDMAQDVGAGGYRGSRYQKSKNRHSVGVQPGMSKEGESDGSADPGAGGKDERGGQRWTTQGGTAEKPKNSGLQLAGRRSPSVMSPDAGSGLGVALGQGPTHYQPEANRHEFSQPVINGRQPAQLDPSAPGRSENQKKLLQYGGWAMSGYTTMPLKSQLVTSDYRDSRVSASNNALGKIAETEPMNQPMPAEAASARQKSHELRLASSSYAKQPHQAYGAQANADLNAGRPRPHLQINAQLNAARNAQQVGMSPGTLGAGGLASVGIVRAADAPYQSLPQYNQQLVGVHDRSKAGGPEAALQSTELLAQSHNLHYGPVVQQLPRGSGKPALSNQPSLRQSPTAASAGSTIIGSQRRNPRANVMQDLRDQIAHESAALEMLNKQKQLQLQLERQEQLLHQLQNQLISQQLGASGGGVEGAGTGSGAKPGQHDDYQSSLMQIGSVISGNKARPRPTAVSDVKQLSMATDPSSGASLNPSPTKVPGRPSGRGIQAPRMQPNDLGQLMGSPDGLNMAQGRMRRNQEAAEDAITAVLTRSVATDSITKHAAGTARGGELTSARHRNARPAASGPAGSASVAQAAGSLLMQGSSAQQVRGASTGDQGFGQSGHAYHTEGPQPPNHYFAGEPVKGSSAPDRAKALASKYDGGLRQSQTKRTLAMVEGRMHPSTLPANNDTPYKLSQGLQGQKLPQAANVHSPALNAGGNYGGPVPIGAQAANHYTPMTNASLLFNNQSLRNVEQLQHQARPALYDGVGSPGLASADKARLDQGMGIGLVASASADRRAGQVPTNRFHNADIAGEINHEAPGGSHSSALQPSQRNPSTHLSRPSHAHSATKHSGHSKINPLIVQSNRSSHVDGLRISNLDAGRVNDLNNAGDSTKQANIFASIDGYKAPHPQMHGLHGTEQKRPVIKKDNILFSSAVASVPSFRSKQPGPQAPQVPIMIVNGVARRPSEQRVAKSRQGGANL